MNLKEMNVFSFLKGILCVQCNVSARSDVYLADAVGGEASSL